jgi:vacuolar-type H+-ATPase subunit E/Vma4
MKPNFTELLDQIQKENRDKAYEMISEAISKAEKIIGPNILSEVLYSESIKMAQKAIDH